MSDPTIEATILRQALERLMEMERQALERLTEIERRVARIQALIEKIAIANGISAHG